MTVAQLRAIVNDPAYDPSGTVLLHDMEAHEYNVLEHDEHKPNDGDLVLKIA